MKEAFSKIVVPLLDLKAQYKTIQDQIEPAILQVVRAQSCILGETVKSFEEECARYCECNYAIGVSSGTDALLMALMALNIENGDEVITTTYSFFSTAGSIYRVGARAIFVDIDPKTFNLVPEQVEKAITPKTKAIMPVHLYGQCAQMDKIMEIARKHKLFVIEDAAQAIGAKYNNKKAGSFGEIGCFSFYPSKNLGGIGDGGLITCNDKALYEKLVKLRNHGSSHTYYHEMVGGNFRLDAIQAAALKVKLQHLEEWHKGRIKNAQDYSRLFKENGLLEKVELPFAGEGFFHIYNQFVIRVSRRNELKEYLTQKNIGNAIYYPLPLHRQTCFAKWDCAKQNLPEADIASENTLALPIYPELSMEQKEYVVASIKEFFSC